MRESDELYQQAEGEPDEIARHNLLTQSTTRKTEALEMLRTALLDGELEAYADQAKQDLFNLRQNLIVVLCELDRCAEALEQIEEAMSDSEILPESATARIASMRASVVDCEARVEQAAAEEAAVEEWLEPIETDATDPSAAAGSASEETAPPPSDETDTADSTAVPIALIAGGAAIAIGGLIWDLALGGTRDDFEALQAACASGCDTETHTRAQDLQGELDTGAIGTLLLYGVGGATAVVGVVLLILSGGDEDPPVAVAPLWGAGQVGAWVGFDF